VAVPLVIVPVILGGVPFFVLVALAAVIAAMEGAAIFRGRGLHPPLAVAGALAFALVLATGRPDLLPLPELIALFPPALLVGVAWRGIRGAPVGVAFVEALLAAYAALYVGGLLRYALLVRELPHGLAWAAVALLGTWGTDTAGYFAGQRWGRRRLAPAISPGKTWEGALAGVAVASAAALAVSPWLGVGVVPATLLGIVIGVAAIAGDLFESGLKRLGRVKDASQLMPGHGGLLDRIDSLLFVVPVCYLYARLVSGS
jgi:phosphatidate cytidylyltransferase